jgi:hypothetical protein
MIVEKLKLFQYYSTKLPKFLQKFSKLSKLHNLESHFSELLRPRKSKNQKKSFKPDHF